MNVNDQQFCQQNVHPFPLVVNECSLHIPSRIVWSFLPIIIDNRNVNSIHFNGCFLHNPSVIHFFLYKAIRNVHTNIISIKKGRTHFDFRPLYTFGITVWVRIRGCIATNTVRSSTIISLHNCFWRIFYPCSWNFSVLD